jgi:hypothetical protein
VNSDLWIFLVFVGVVFGISGVRYVVHRHRDRVAGNPPSAELPGDYRPNDLPRLPNDEPAPGHIGGQFRGGDWFKPDSGQRIPGRRD